jgi:transcriptional regulator with XRE-family HTH domain
MVKSVENEFPDAPRRATPVTASLADVIRGARQRAGLTQASLADRVGYERSAIARIETGKTVRPPRNLLERCERALNLSPGDLTALSERPFRTGNMTSDSKERVRLWPSFPYSLAQDIFSSSQDRIRILQSWVTDAQPFLPNIARALESGAVLEILVLDPSSDTAKLRARSLNIDDPQYPSYQMSKMLSDLKRLDSLERRGAQRYEVRTYDASPSLQMYGTEDRIILGFFWMTEFSLQGPQVEVSTGDSTLGRMAWQEFEKVWRSSPIVGFSR